MNKPHKKLDAWTTAVDLVQQFYTATDRFPSKEQFGLTNQARRAAISIPSNIAEGAAVDFGWSGKVQFAIAIRDNTLADQSGSNGFEVDNDGSGTAATPFTSGTFANVTIIGPKKTFDMNIQDNFQNGMTCAETIN